MATTVSKGQSAIEYLTTYGWMLLVIAIVGGAIFTTVQGQTQVQSTSGLANADVQIRDFGVTSSGLKIELRAASAEQVENVNVSLVNPETGETVYASNEYTIPVGGTKTITFPNVGNSQNINKYNVVISYDSGGLNDLTVKGSLTGSLTINGTIPTGSEELVLASQHTTAQEFSKQQLTNLTVEGSGDAASVTLPTGSKIFDGFEDADTSEWGSGVTITALSRTPYEGTYTGELSDGGGTFGNFANRTSISTSGQVNLSGYMMDVGGDSTEDDGVYLAMAKSSTGGQYVARMSAVGDFIEIRDTSAVESYRTSVSLSTDTHYHVKFGRNQDTGEMLVRIYNTSGTKLAEVAATDTTFTPDSAGVGTYRNSPQVDNFQVTEDAPPSATYLGSHSVSNPEEAAINIVKASNVSVQATIRTTGGTILNQTTLTTTGNHSLVLSSTSSENLETVLNVDVTGSNPRFKMDEESILSK